MTGRELIIYILQNSLEDNIVIKDGYFVTLMDEAEAAAKFKVGEATIKAWYDCGMLKGTKIGNSIFFKRDIERPNWPTQSVY